MVRERIHVLHVIESLGRGGAERQLVDLVRWMDRLRFVNTVCHLYERDDLKSELVACGVPVVGLQLRSRRDGIKAIGRLRSLLRAGQYAVLHTWLYEADIVGRVAGKLAGTPLIVSAMQNSWYEPQVTNIRRSKLALIRALDSWTGKWCRAHFVAASEFVKQSMVKRLGFPEAHIEVIYNAVDPQVFQPGDGAPLEDLRRSLGLNDCFPVLICVARLVPQKGHAHLLDAMPAVLRRYSAAQLLVVGRGEEESRLKERAARLNVQSHVHFLGQRSDVKELFQLSDIFVFPSLCAEGLPVSVVEAMAMGKPCVAWHVEPNPEVIKHGVSGLLVEPKHPEKFAEAICSVAAQPEMCRAMGERARAIVEETFNVHRTVKQVEALYERGLNRRSR